MRITLSNENRPLSKAQWLMWFAAGSALVAGILIAGVIAGGILYRDGLRPRNVVAKLREYTVDQIRGVNAHLTAPAVSKIRLDIAFEDFEKISAKRDEALTGGYLFSSDDDLVPATVFLDEQPLDARVRLKGDLIDHLLTDKWSFRVELQGDDRAWGMRRFSLQHPGTRHFNFEQGFLENLRYEGVLAPRYEFVDVTVNGSFWGVYAFEEFFGKEMLESQGRRAGVIFGFDEQYFWEHVSVPPTGLTAFELLKDNYLSSNAAINVFDQGRVSEDPELSAQADRAIQMIRLFQEGELDATEVFDVDRMATFLALSELWQVRHSLVANNLRFYYNPVSGLIEPIGFDAQPEPVLVKAIAGFNDVPHQPLIGTILEHPVFLAAFVRELDRVLQPGYIDEMNGAFGEKISDSILALRREFPEVVSVWPVVKERQAWLRKVMNPSVAGVGYARIDVADSGPNVLRIDVANSLAVRVVITSVDFIPIDESTGEVADEARLLDSMAVGNYPTLPSRQTVDAPLEFREFSFPISVENATQILSGAQLRVWGKIVGQDTERIIPVRIIDGAMTTAGAPTPLTVEELRGLWPFAEVDETNRIVTVPTGSYIVQDCIALPEHFSLTIEAGTTMSFERAGCLMLTGSFEVSGTESEPVLFGPTGDSWLGIHVQRAGRVSTWKNVSVRGTRGFDWSGRQITGGVSFNESPLVLRAVAFEGSSAEDALNVIGTSVDFQNVSFVSAKSDGFDGDAVTGFIRDTEFLSIGGDGLDVSGSNLEVDNLVFDKIVDKAMSIGEASTVTASNIVVIAAGIGIASKDLSHVSVTSVTIDGISEYALAAYQKKPEYGAASLEVVGLNTSLSDDSFLSQGTSRLMVNGQRIESSDIDIGLLYDSGVLGN